MTRCGSSRHRPGEFELIARLFAPLAISPHAFGLKDDAALIQAPPDQDLVITTDAIVEGVHFFRSDSPDLIARKALRVNLSDLAAKGAIPSGYLLVLSLPEWINLQWLEMFAAGLRQDQQAFDIGLLGGDTTSTTGPVTIAITAFGFVPRNSMLRRTGAKQGDYVFLTGTVGDAGGGLSCLKGEGGTLAEGMRQFLVRRFHLPEPRIRFGSNLRGLASAALDVSDGLMADLGHLAELSGLRIEVEAAKIPISQALAQLWAEPRQRAVWASTAGDDYEIAFTAPPENQGNVMRLAGETGTPVTLIGRVAEGHGVGLLNTSGTEIPLPRFGYVHF